MQKPHGSLRPASQMVGLHERDWIWLLFVQKPHLSFRAVTSGEESAQMGLVSAAGCAISPSELVAGISGGESAQTRG